VLRVLFSELWESEQIQSARFEKAREERLEFVDKSEMKTRSWDEAEKDIFKK
jgi:hypothetical protein